ncbi:hypothetical protein ACOSQ2_022252 [Xanthoceras sorbifolium]|uniref:Uncharacterized protein n=1 Tax=Xanthoceras sorbifolium TaxID=99658 RepID=A0ABQ8HNC7_9ROSI|nr:hypothetical protein JRO89_XS08G0028200 [Xanthoceras sorbifolium]
MRIFNSLQLQVLQKIPTKAMKPNWYVFSSLTKAPTQTPNTNTSLFNYLIQTLNFSQTEAQSISTRVSNVKSPENPHSVLHYFRSIGFSETDIRLSVRSAPGILFSDVDKSLKPKMEFFQGLGLVGSDLGKFISKNSLVLNINLEKHLIPRIELIKKILVDDINNETLIKVISRCNWLVSARPESKLLSNIAFLESCGIVGSHLSLLLKRQPRIFIMEDSKVRNHVSRVLDMGFSVDSSLFVHALHTVSGLNVETFLRKLELFRSFGYTKDEYMEMFRRQPMLPTASEKKLKLALEFFLNKIGLEKAALIRAPWCLMLSLEERVIPRYRVMQIVRSKRLLKKKEPSLTSVLNISEKKFLERYVARFRDDTEELLVAYKGHLLDSSSLSSPVEES